MITKSVIKKGKRLFANFIGMLSFARGCRELILTTVTNSTNATNILNSKKHLVVEVFWTKTYNALRTSAICSYAPLHFRPEGATLTFLGKAVASGKLNETLCGFQRG